MSSATDRWIDAHRDEFLDDLIELLRIPSVNGASEPDAPFGREIRRALDFTMGLCRKFGLRTAQLDGKVGYTDWGQGAEMLGILTHVDVVKADGAWDTPPFTPTLKDGVLTARGVQDDKGAVVASIYALAAVKACGLPFRRSVRLLFGCDEEQQMRGLAHYLSSGEPVPDLSFSPDAEFPVVNSEMHICSAEYSLSYPSSITIQAGTAVNAVPGTACAYVPLSAEDSAVRSIHVPDGFQVHCTSRGIGCQIQVTGVPAHACVPHLGKNALQAMLCLLSHLPLPQEDRQALCALADKFQMNYYGQGLGLEREDPSGRLTLNLGIMEWNASGYRLGIDLRVPTSMEQEQVRDTLDQALKGVAHRTAFRFSQGFYRSEDSELVSSLAEVFARRYGKRLPMVNMGGGTYARDLPNAVSFGPLMPGKADQCHVANESMSLEDLFFNAKVIADAIEVLALEQG